MKIGVQPHGSMGIPPQMQEAFEKQRADAKRKQAAAAKADEQAPTFSEDPGFAEDSEQAEPLIGNEPEANKAETEDSGKNKIEGDPHKILAELGISLTEEDAHRYVFKGFVEKDLTVEVIMGVKIPVTFKSLTSTDQDEIGELLADEINRVSVLRDEVAIRRNMWMLCYGISKMNGRILAHPETKKLTRNGKTVEVIDRKASARNYREVLGMTADETASALIEAYNKFSIALSLLRRQGKEEGSLLKK